MDIFANAVAWSSQVTCMLSITSH